MKNSTPSIEERPTQENGSGTRAARVLVVEDERHIARFLEFILKKEGYEVTIAYDGEQALKVVDQCAPDAILLDMVLPGISGLDVLKRLRADRRHADRVIVVLSASLFGDLPAEVMEAGANTHCTKPIAPSDLLRKLAEFGVPPVIHQGAPASSVNDEVTHERAKS